MKTKSLIYFQYQNGATSYYVSATEYGLHSGGVQFRLAIGSGEGDADVVVTRPETRAEAVRLAEEAIAGFVREMAQVYLADIGG